MENKEFRRIRQSLWITQAQLAAVLGYEDALTISTYERKTNPRKIPNHVAKLMAAYDSGYRPVDWPKQG